MIATQVCIPVCMFVVLCTLHPSVYLPFSCAGSLIGFINMGDVNSHLLAFEQSPSADQSSSGTLANTMLVFMVKGLFSSLKYPYAQFPSHSPSSDELFHPFWESVSRLKQLGFKVMGLCCDGLAANCWFFSLHSNEPNCYKVVTPYAAENQYLYFFIDPPHLMKTVQNTCMGKPEEAAVGRLYAWCISVHYISIYFAPCTSINCLNLYDEEFLLYVTFQYNGHDIEWSHLCCLYKRNWPISESPSLAMLHKLKFEHINFTSFSRMTVDLAAQVSNNFDAHVHVL